MVEAVDADEFDVWADSGLTGETGCKASPAEEQEFRRLIDTATWQQTAQVLKPPELTQVNWFIGRLGLADRGDAADRARIVGDDDV